MIVIRYTGGLGNQMFVYAMHTVIAQKYPEEKIYVDLTRYDLTKEHDGFDIQKYFEIHVKEMPREVLKDIAPIHYWFRRWGLKKVMLVASVNHIEKMNEYVERKNKRVGIISDLDSTNYNENIFERNCEQIELWHYKGNWINPLYWNGYENMVKNSFRFKMDLLSLEDRKLMEEMESSQSVSIHIRKGDYKGNERFELCDDVYYEHAIAYIQDFEQNKPFKYYIFSDEEVELSALKNIDYQVVSHPQECGVDLWLMSKCRHNIIANSTFSYWAALLNANNQKIVIAPKYAYKEKAVYRKFPIPKEWVQIDNVAYKSPKSII